MSHTKSYNTFKFSTAACNATPLALIIITHSLVTGTWAAYGFLKELMLVADVITFGRLFQSAGVATVKLQSPSMHWVLSWVVAGESR